mgnify:FL=1
MKKVEFEVITDKFEEGLPTYYVLKKVYYFGFYFYGQLLGQNGKDIAFQDAESAEDYKQILEENGRQ